MQELFDEWKVAYLEHAEKKMRLTLGESAASDNESTPAPKQVI